MDSPAFQDSTITMNRNVGNVMHSYKHVRNNREISGPSFRGRQVPNSGAIDDLGTSRKQAVRAA